MSSTDWSEITNAELDILVAKALGKLRYRANWFESTSDRKSLFCYEGETKWGQVAILPYSDNPSDFQIVKSTIVYKGWCWLASSIVVCQPAHSFTIYRDVEHTCALGSQINESEQRAGCIAFCEAVLKEKE